MAVTGSCCACFVTITNTQSTPADQYGTTVVAGEDAQKTWVSPRLTPCRSQGDDEQEEVISTVSLPIPVVWALIFLKHFIKYPFRQICLAAILNITSPPAPAMTSLLVPRSLLSTYNTVYKYSLN